MLSESRKKKSSIDEFIANFPKEVQIILQKIRTLVHELVPAAEECIAYGIPTFRFQKHNLVHFAAFKNHIGFYPTPSGIEAFKDKITPYEYSKGSIKFPLKEPIPYDLIKEIVTFRLSEEMIKSTAKKRQKKV